MRPEKWREVRKKEEPKPKRLSLPIVREVREVVCGQQFGFMDHVGHFTLIAPDPNAGRKHRYSVIRIDYQTGQAECIGRELDLKLARKVAKS